MTEDQSITPLDRVTREVDRFVNDIGWDQAPQLFALVDTAELVRDQPGLADAIGISTTTITQGELTPVEQDPLPLGPLDETLGRIAWPANILGCALAQQIVVLSGEEEDAIPDDIDAADYAAQHPERREARLVVAVLRDGSRSSLIRLRSDEPEQEDSVLAASDLAPNMADALLATLS